MRDIGWLPEPVQRWLTLSQPVTYWSLWRDLLELTPVFAVLFGLLVVLAGAQFTVLTFAPIPFVFVAVTAGYAFRDLDLLSGFWSFLLALAYGFVLAVTDVGWLLLQRPPEILSVVAVLTFVALVAGFAAPSLHGRADDREFQAAYRRHQLDDDDD